MCAAMCAITIMSRTMPAGSAIEQAMKQLKFATERKMVHRALTMLTARPAAPQTPAAEGGA